MHRLESMGSFNIKSERDLSKYGDILCTEAVSMEKAIKETGSDITEGMMGGHLQGCVGRPGRILSPPRKAEGLACSFPSSRPDLAAQEPGICRSYLVPGSCQSNLGSITETGRGNGKQVPQLIQAV